MVKVTEKIEKDTFEKRQAPTRGRQKATKVQEEGQQQKEGSQVTTRSRAAAQKEADNKTTEIVENLKIFGKEIILKDVQNVQNMKNNEIKHPVVSTRGAKKHVLAKNYDEETIIISQEEV